MQPPPPRTSTVGRPEPSKFSPILYCEDENGHIIGNFQTRDNKPYITIPIRSALTLRKVKEQQEKNKKEGG